MADPQERKEEKHLASTKMEQKAQEALHWLKLKLLSSSSIIFGNETVRQVLLQYLKVLIANYWVSESMLTHDLSCLTRAISNSSGPVVWAIIDSKIPLSCTLGLCGELVIRLKTSIDDLIVDHQYRNSALASPPLEDTTGFWDDGSSSSSKP